MAAERGATFKNDRGVAQIRIGVSDSILCAYCATRFRYYPRLEWLGAQH